MRAPVLAMGYGALGFWNPNTRAAYAGDLASLFVWCAAELLPIWDVRRHHLARYLATPKPDGRPFAPKTLERRLAAVSGFYAYAELGLIDRHPRGHRKPLAVNADMEGVVVKLGSMTWRVGAPRMRVCGGLGGWRSGSAGRDARSG